MTEDDKPEIVVEGYAFGKPETSRKFHIFKTDGKRALCGKYLMGATQRVFQSDLDEPDKDDCRKCHEVLRRLTRGRKR